MRNFREVLSKQQTVYAPGVWDGLSALCAREAGFEVLCSSGFALSASLGVPDVELYSSTDAFQAVARIHEASGLPVVADIDTGYGNAVTVMQTVRRVQAAGASAFFMEDQVSPKRCPMSHAGAAEVIPLPEARGKIRAAVEAKHDSSLLIARTDTQGDEALGRMKHFLADGADLVMGTTKTFASVSEWRSVGEKLGDRLALTIVAGTWLAEDFDLLTLQDCGVRIAVLPTQAILETSGQLVETFSRLVREPQSGGREMERAKFLDLVGYDSADRALAAYGPESGAI
ncbi:isocitrate lyase/PEP mutase family protein [Arthrobacter sp. AK01]|nr:isocitrate lyase/PEP mutase family protein [Arthrobacter sp. AK01]